MAMKTGGELLILAPGVERFGEDAENDRLIRKYGYVGRDNIIRLFYENEDLRSNQSVAAHLIHGSPDGRFHVTYALSKLTEREAAGAALTYMPYEQAAARYNPEALSDGCQTLPDGERIFFIKNPALGLWSVPF
jgi:hypothetical protein